MCIKQLVFWRID